ncbi:MAG: acetolactate synthase large subunit [Candidatus Microgenomates bacterium]
MKTSDLLVKALESEKIQFVFGVPGEENLEFLNSLKNSQVRFIPTRHEQAAGFMAATIGRLTGIPGVALSTLGPGATNLVTAVAYATLGGMPTLFLTGQKPIKNSKQGQFQIISTVDMMRPLSKYSHQIVSASLAGINLHHALKTAKEERPGATHLELPEDIASEEISEFNYPLTPPPRRPIAEPKAIKHAVSLLEQAKHPLLIIGSGANRKRASKMLNLLLDKTHIPFCTTQMGKGVISESRPEYLGTTALSTGDYVHDEIKKADVILNIGHDTIEKPPFILTNTNSQKIIHLNFFSPTSDSVYIPDLEVIGDIANAIWQITETITPQSSWDLASYAPVKSRIEKNLSRNTFSPFNLITTLRKLLAADDIVALDNGMYKLWFARHYEALLPNTLLLDNALATMGAGLPSAIAAKMINPDKKIICVVGDGGFAMSLGDLETARRLNLDLTIIVLRDNRYGMIDWKQSQLNYPSFGLDFTNPDFSKLASAYDLIYFKIDNPALIQSILQKALNSSGVTLVEYPIDYSDNQFLGKKL